MLITNNTLFSMKNQIAAEGQDKEPLTRFTAASAEPETAALPPETAVNKKKQHGSETRQTAHLAGRCPWIIKEKFMEIAKANGWNESYAVNMAVQQFVENTFGLKLGATLAATVTEAITKTMKPYETRLATLSLETLYEAREVKLFHIQEYREVLSAKELYNLRVEIHDKARRMSTGGAPL
jgi:hypothetical protein